MAYLVEHYGDIASIVSLLVSFVGFGVTIWNVRKAKFAAEEAKSAAREAFTRFRLQLLISEMESLSSSLRSAEACCRAKNWDDALTAFAAFRAGIAKLKENDRLLDEDRLSLGRFLDQVRTTIQSVHEIQCDKASADRTPTNPKADLSRNKYTIIHNMIVYLGEMQGRLLGKAPEIE